MEEIFTVIVNQVLPHWPFLMIAMIFTVVGQFTSKSVFTRERAYRKAKDQWFWWWGRETLAIHPILSGCLVGLIWQNPEGVDPAWKLVASASYFAGAGVISLFAWAILKGILKKKGIDLDLPGESIAPPPVKTEKAAPDSPEDSENA